jgi:hypothetical protein
MSPHSDKDLAGASRKVSAKAVFEPNDRYMAHPFAELVDLDLLAFVTPPPPASAPGCEERCNRQRFASSVLLNVKISRIGELSRALLPRIAAKESRSLKDPLAIVSLGVLALRIHLFEAFRRPEISKLTDRESIRFRYKASEWIKQPIVWIEHVTVANNSTAALGEPDA